MADGGVIRIEHWTNAAEQGARRGAQPARRARRSASRTRRSRTSGPTSTTSRSSRSGCPRAPSASTVLEPPDGDRLVLGGERDGRLIAAIAFNAPRRLPFYRRALAAMPPIEEVVAAVARRREGAGRRRRWPHEQALVLHARRLGPARPAGGVARRARDPVRPAPHLRRRADAGRRPATAFVASLGSNRNPNDTDDPAVAAELVAAARRDRARRPGARPLLRRPGARRRARRARSRPRREPELGWTTIETDDPERIPAGPWLEWHFDRFAVPPGATEVARTGAAPQAFRHGRHLGVQFHPESTVEIVARWAASDARAARRARARRRAR